MLQEIIRRFSVKLYNNSSLCDRWTHLSSIALEYNLLQQFLRFTVYILFINVVCATLLHNLCVTLYFYSLWYIFIYTIFGLSIRPSLCAS